MLEDIRRTPLLVDPRGAERAESAATGQTAARVGPTVCPCDRVLADVRLAMLGVRLPLAVLGDDVEGEPPSAGRVRIPVTADELDRALVAGGLIIADCESTPVGSLADLSTGPDGEWVEGHLVVASALPLRQGESRVVVVAERPLTEPDLQHLRKLDSDEVVLVVPTAGPTPDGLPAAVLRQCLEAVAPAEFTLLPLPISWRGTAVDDALASAVTTALDGTHLFRTRPATEVHRHAGDLLWVDALERVQAARKTPATNPDELLAKVLPVLTRWRPPRHSRGLVVFFTGLSGSGKSTLAKALADHLAAQADRTVTLLDGDVVRRMLSSGLGFDRAGRDLNVRRIGFVAAEVARHGGIAVCAPIAPYDESRAAVREMVEAVGDLVLIHVATPLAECERRDVKGLYRKARAGVVTQFTGISDPYDEPMDAEIRIDTSGTSPAESLAVITDYLVKGGWLARGPGKG
ncbi:adenylyl-sulfate kinase [Kribbella caucasensis]|uniref:adenylyl-sulfate kinase n=1 Tax=Kribbella caucasensis TaxID=2512215 RepID=UPI001EE12CEC|nr:adenylyl-sulfate kinase [Kribbella sp. VKM Ac-2527]